MRLCRASGWWGHKIPEKAVSVNATFEPALNIMHFQFRRSNSMGQLLYTFLHTRSSQLRFMLGSLDGICDVGQALHYQQGSLSGAHFGPGHSLVLRLLRLRGSCRPYEIHPCGHHGNEPYYGECYEDAKTPRCKRRCLLDYRKSYPSDKRYGKRKIEFKSNEHDKSNLCEH
ncbi:hypothetical protein TELCIR_12018 [Teladorsagia circumcincta]|uniref:Uncharacterized protein n=1 Tax=Teladorsagia circumcincta TaxID=45464 RepID=A0A2G9U7T4_TELCI|nr:hypothetical protein TELCIR_12018 [Teladorsagia circumcincta]